MQAERALKQSTEQTAEEAIHQFELMLDNTAQASRELPPLAGQTCNDVKLALREQVTRRPFVRSTNRVWDNTIYCSSLFGDVQEKIVSGDYSKGALLLMKGNPDTPDTALLVYRLSEEKQGAMSTLDGYHLSNVLRLIGRKTSSEYPPLFSPDYLTAHGVNFLARLSVRPADARRGLH